MRATPHVCWKKQAPSFDDSYSFSISSLALCWTGVSLKVFLSQVSLACLGSSLCRGDPVAALLGTAALLFIIVWMGNCFSKWSVILLLTPSQRVHRALLGLNHYVASSLRSLRNNLWRGSQSIPFLGRLVVACHHVGISFPAGLLN